MFTVRSLLAATTLLAAVALPAAGQVASKPVSAAWPLPSLPPSGEGVESTRLVEGAANVGGLGRLHFTRSGRVIENTPPAPLATPGADPRRVVLEGANPICHVVASYADVAFTGGTYTLQAGFSEGEIAAVQYLVPAAAFPIKLDLFEAIVAARNAVVSTTTRYSVMVWQGNPATGTLLFSIDSGEDIPNIVLPIGTAGVNVNFSVDPNDPDQIIINDDGSHSFTVGLRIVDHNDQTGNPCNVGPDSTRNAFPTTDNTVEPPPCAVYPQLQQPTRNWLFGLNCGPNGCPSNGGWSTFGGLRVDTNIAGFCIPGCRPHGDWVIRATWSSLTCTPGVGACCLPGGECQTLAVADCEAAGGMYQGDGVACDPGLCPQPTGACCFGNGACLVFNAEQCAIAGGTYLGNDTTCAAGDLCPLGACCLPDGSCTTATASQCSAQQGTFRGAGTDCATANCPPAMGACCVGANGCLRLTPAQCQTAGGTYLGHGTACTPQNTCPTGACCLPSGECTVLNSVACGNAGGTFAGVGVTCGNANCPQPSGACCLANGNCLVLPRGDCLVIPDAMFAGPDTACDACEPDCPFDLNGDGFLDPDDLSDYIAAYFAVPPGPETDLNGDGTTDPDDLADYIAGYFGGC